MAMIASELRAAAYAEAAETLGRGATEAELWRWACEWLAERYVAQVSRLTEEAPAIQTGLPGIEQSGSVN